MELHNEVGCAGGHQILGLHIVSMHSRAHLYGIRSRVFVVRHVALQSRAFGVGYTPTWSRAFGEGAADILVPTEIDFYTFSAVIL